MFSANFKQLFLFWGKQSKELVQRSDITVCKFVYTDPAALQEHLPLAAMRGKRQKKRKEAATICDGTESMITQKAEFCLSNDTVFGQKTRTRTHERNLRSVRTFNTTLTLAAILPSTLTPPPDRR